MITGRIDQSEGHLITDLFNQYRVFYGQPQDITGSGSYLNECLQGGQSFIFAVFDRTEQPVNRLDLPSFILNAAHLK